MLRLSSRWLILAHAGMATTTANAADSERPCDILQAAGQPCVAAHSTTRALYATYDGGL